MSAHYIGDGAYAEMNAHGTLVLATSNGRETTNTIFLEREVWAALLSYMGGARFDAPLTKAGRNVMVASLAERAGELRAAATKAREAYKSAGLRTDMRRMAEAYDDAAQLLEGALTKARVGT